MIRTLGPLHLVSHPAVVSSWSVGTSATLPKQECLALNAPRNCYRLLAVTAFAVLAIQSPGATPTRQTRRAAASPLSQPTGAKLSSDYGKLPLAFEPNMGQTDPRVRFLARGGGMTTFFTDTR